MMTTKERTIALLITFAAVTAAVVALVGLSHHENQVCLHTQCVPYSHWTTDYPTLTVPET